jgi:hypothetical protein
MKKITVTRVQQVEIPVSDDFLFKDFINALTEHSLFDDDRIDWEKEEVVEEDYSYAPYRSKFEDENCIKTFATPYSIGTVYSDLTPMSFYTSKK